MQDRADYTVPIDEAMRRLDIIPDYDPGDGPKPCVHTFVGGVIPVGAHWAVEDVRALFEEHGVEESGEMATAMGHGLVVVRPAPSGPLFIATREPETADAA